MKYAKHIHVLHLLSTIPVGRGLMTTQQANQAFDHLFGYIFEHWAKPTSAGSGRECGNVFAGDLGDAKDCRTMLYMDAAELTSKLESLPPYFNEVLFPIVVARYMFRELAMPIRHRECRHFTEFHVRYGALVLY